MHSNTKPQPTQYFLTEARDSVRLARQKAESGSATPETLQVIHQLCATSEFNLSRALRDSEVDAEAREAATLLLTSKNQTQPTS